MYSQGEVRDLVHDITENAKTLLHRAEDNARGMIDYLGNRLTKAYPVWEKKIHKTYPLIEKKITTAYPVVVSHLQDGSRRALSMAKSSGRVVRSRAEGLSCRLGRDLRVLESCLVYVGLGYLVLKLYKACDNGEVSPAGRVKAHIHKKPAESVLIALGVGLLLGKILT